MSARQVVTAALFVDCGSYVQGRWVKEPRAKYECVRCRTTEGPVQGAERVREFVARIRTDHPAYCTANQGAQAA